jgi:hypothetical protein
MTLGKLAVYARKIHRILVLFISVLGVAMAITGLTLHEAEEGGSFLPYLKADFAGEVHNSLSTYFAFVLGLMIITGLMLYLYPWLQKIFRKTPNL